MICDKTFVTAMRKNAQNNGTKRKHLNNGHWHRPCHCQCHRHCHYHRRCQGGGGLGAEHCPKCCFSGAWFFCCFSVFFMFFVVRQCVAVVTPMVLVLYWSFFDLSWYRIMKSSFRKRECMPPPQIQTFSFRYSHALAENAKTISMSNLENSDGIPNAAILFA